MDDEEVIGWVKRQAAGAICLFSVCTGALICGAAGLLKGRRATTHWTAFHLLPIFGAIPVNERVVIDGEMVFAAGVSRDSDLHAKQAGFATATGVQIHGERCACREDRN
jgi:cyclohexyl-isocyanide hydratase